MNKKGNVDGLSAFVLGLTGVCVVLTISFIIFAELSDTTGACATGYTYNATAKNCYLTTNASVTATELTGAPSALTTLTTKLATVPSWVGILIVVSMSALVLSYFYMKGR